jgi:hypothetical protein
MFSGGEGFRLRFLSWAAVLIFSLVAVGLCIKALAQHGVPVSENLIVRGLSCLAAVVILAGKKRLRLVPKSVRTQFVRAMLAGLALTFLTLSYNWLSASTVSVLSNVDVPLLIVLGPVFGVRASRTVRGLALLSIALLIVYTCNLEKQASLVYGLTTLVTGSLLLCFGYLFIKKSMTEENEAVAVLTPSLAIIAYGFMEGAVSSQSWSAWSPGLLAVGAISGLAMFLAYVATMRLYELTDIASAEFPTLLAAVIIQPLETLFLGEPVRPVYLYTSLAFVLVTLMIMRLQNPEPAHAR